MEEERAGEISLVPITEEKLDDQDLDLLGLEAESETQEDARTLEKSSKH